MYKMILVVLVACAFLASGSMIMLPANGEMTVGEEGDIEYETEEDPTEETPTDGSVGVSIDSYGIDFDESGESIEMEVKVDGTTSGTVVKCAMTTVTYMKDGMHQVGSWEVGPEIQNRTTLERYFKGTGSGGEDDWSTWGYYFYSNRPKREYEENNPGEYMKNVTRVIWVVRAFSDDEMTMWNQDTEDVTDMYRDVISGEPTDDVEYETEGDPTTHTPTDGSIEASIDSYGAEFDDSGDKVEMEINVEGSTSGTVVKCAMTTVTYFKNGSYEVGGWDVGPYDKPETTRVGVTSESYFKGIDGEGDDDWSSWGYRLYFGVLEELYDLSRDMGMDLGDEMDVENVTKVVLVVRAFSDEEMTMWNQDTRDVTDEYKAFISGESLSKDDDGGLPGFELFGAVVAFVAVAGLGFAFRRRR